MENKADDKALAVKDINGLFSPSNVTFNYSVEELQGKKFAKNMKDKSFNKAAAAFFEEILNMYHDSYLNPRRLKRQT
jgi:hypothetical protein